MLMLVQPPLLITGDELMYLQMKGGIPEIISVSGAVNFCVTLDLRKGGK